MDTFEDILLSKPEIETLISNIGRSRWVEQSNAGSFSLKLVDQEQEKRPVMSVLLYVKN